jgi:hypothetical protein
VPLASAYCADAAILQDWDKPAQIDLASLVVGNSNRGEIRPNWRRGGKLGPGGNPTDERSRLVTLVAHVMIVAAPSAPGVISGLHDDC